MLKKIMMKIQISILLWPFVVQRICPLPLNRFLTNYYKYIATNIGIFYQSTCKSFAYLEMHIHISIRYTYVDGNI